ncbi:hypothetical protein [Clostridium magnum]|uniref:Uncharacterized protein n=1 Tax=Clostridium magnum DSM 2767 TaxID=1121326 RepID=A0A161W173_9CLOT|nr:hypothetical protein [Clostridium magnum]KZL88900.1 hypothetical protein CLMAG_58040 [Clostridium magnum DSM 2767]SHI52537.1 hypothetical protein SAMN02745944_04451 [Clostridium magnum DSM 2767]
MKSGKENINYIYILCCELAEKNVPFGKGKEIMTKALNNDLSFLEIILDEASESFTELHPIVARILPLQKVGEELPLFISLSNIEFR